MKLRIRLDYLLILSIGFLLGGFAWFISDITRASRIDRLFLYYVDDIFRYCYIKSLPFNPVITLNFSLKTGYALIANFFYFILPFGMLSLRIMNIVFACGTLFLITKIGDKLSLGRVFYSLGILLAASFPVFFLSSLSTLSEVMYSFFICLAIFLAYERKIKPSFFIIAFLPLIRQEGLLYVLIWIFLFRKKVKPQYLFFLFLPAFIWAFSNKILLGHSFIKFIFYLPAKDPPNSMATVGSFFKSIAVLSLHPIFVLSLIGLFACLKNPKHKILKICFICHLFFIVLLQVAHFFDSSGKLMKEIRIFMPLVPLMALLSSVALSDLKSRYKIKNRFLVIPFLILPLVSSFQIKQLQKEPGVSEDSLGLQEEKIIKAAGIWLKEYMEKENIGSVCIIPGSLTTDKIIRRIWMYLPGYANFYALGDNLEVIRHFKNQAFDLATFKLVNLPLDKKYLFASKELLGNKSEGVAQIDLVKDYPSLPLYFYKVILN